MKKKTIEQIERERSMVGKLLVSYRLRSPGTSWRHLPVVQRFRKLRRLVP